MFTPKVLNPTPDPDFVHNLKRIDPDLRVVWGYQRYLKSAWTIERKMPPERYFAAYASLLESGEPRFVQQPIYDTNRPIYGYIMDEETLELNLTQMGYEIIGYREFDLAPEYEWLMFVTNKDGSFRQLDERTLVELRRQYAWHLNQPLSRRRFLEEQERKERAEAQRQARIKDAESVLPDLAHMLGKTLFSKPVGEVLEGTELTPESGVK